MGYAVGYSSARLYEILVEQVEPALIRHGLIGCVCVQAMEPPIMCSLKSTADVQLPIRLTQHVRTHRFLSDLAGPRPPM